MSIPWKKYDAATSEREKRWALLDKELYALCRRYPLHTDMCEVHAKCAIIGRAYGTQIERKISSHGGAGTRGNSINRLGEYMSQHGSEVDAILNKLRHAKEPLTAALLETIVTQHRAFVKLLRARLERRQSARSFVSKYMHFHCPVVPIYDNNANKTLKRRYRWKNRLKLFDMPKGADVGYYRFVMRFWQLYQEAMTARKGVTVKKLDAFLLWITEPSR
jgi:hypothetical protein